MKRKRYHSARFARSFDRLRRHQEASGSTVAAIDAICDIHRARVVEIGAGTGVISEQLASTARWVYAFDRSPFMIDYARRSLRRRGVSNCSFARAEHHRIPLPDRCADVVVAAWTLDSVVLDSPAEPADSWQTAVDAVIVELRRLTTSKGTMLVIASPFCGQRDLPQHLQRAHGLRRHLFKSVWRFPSRATAREAILLFLQRQAWASYRPHWPKDLVTLGGIWWSGGYRSTISIRPRKQRSAP